MARKDLVKHRLPVEYEAEVLEVLEQVGEILNCSYYATEILGVTPTALRSFLRTNRAKEAALRATPLTRQAYKRKTRVIQFAPSEGLVVSEEDLQNLQIIQEDVPMAIAAAFRLVTKKK